MLDRGARRATFGLMETDMRIAALTALIGTLCVAACDDSNNVVSIANINTFVLQTVNGRALPVTIADSIAPPRRIDVLSGSITLKHGECIHRRGNVPPNARYCRHDADGHMHGHFQHGRERSDFRGGGHDADVWSHVHGHSERQHVDGVGPRRPRCVHQIALGKRGERRDVA